MPRLISAADARRQFSTILKQAASGRTVIITERGQPVARLEPYGTPAASGDASSAWNRLFQTLDEGMHLDIRSLDRTSLYDRR
ncbi:type II toxin-antitoxin system prevent-host-death family antitoxin [Azospirillum melinis]|uniref:Antitoxin n=1 Tax=Azospirillum melinis TaxID=328839 RepID=A0ABX2KCJ3_9PROT|nr:type II toxin-antitoxin system prevent-host-death family antitoxin [Azospirillum melinis]NUB00222.1 type II toxin-antitoxin system prevent-host-death family antitoxin [Azospirillum melinis]